MKKGHLGRRTFLAMTAGFAVGCNQAPSGAPVPPISPGRRQSTAESHSSRAATQPAGLGAGADEPAIGLDEGEESKVEHEGATEASDLLRVYLQPLGNELPPDDVAYIHRALQVFYPLEVNDLEPRALPQDAYYPPRQRYRAEKLLDFLQSHAPPDSHVIIGLTAIDISTTKGQYEDWGILGLASVAGGECVISRFRAKREARDDTHTRERLAKTVVHEVGHTLGLLHCPNYGCLMEDGKGSVKTTDHEYDLCDQCRARLGARVRPRSDRSIPWPRP